MKHHQILSRLNEQSFISPENNIILEDHITFHYITAMARIIGFRDDIHFIPTNGIQNITGMVNLLLGWKIKFGVVLMQSDGALLSFAQQG